MSEGRMWTKRGAGEATVPAVNHEAFAAVDTENIGETTVNGLYRVLGASSLPASTAEKVRKVSFYCSCSC